MTQNAISNEPYKTLGDPDSAFGNYWVLKFHDPTQDTFTPLVLSGFRWPCIIIYMHTMWLAMLIFSKMQLSSLVGRNKLI